MAAALVVASGVVADVPLGPRFIRRTGRYTVAAVLAVRGLAGSCGRTDLLVPGSSSPRFRRLDQRYYSPLCLALAASAVNGR